MNVFGTDVIMKKTLPIKCRINVEQRIISNSMSMLGYKPGLEFDRIDNDKGYVIGNLQMLKNKLKSKAINLTRDDVLFLILFEEKNTHVQKE